MVDDCDARKDWHWEIADRDAEESVEVIEPVTDVATSSSWISNCRCFALGVSNFDASLSISLA
jgi:hypothetical protein